MSKKKATMTLKDFHGGSIPSDLPLPSAPGVTVRPSAWGNPIGRSDNRLRPGSAGAARNIDDKGPHLSPNVHIGRHFDEDERKPLDGASGPRRTFSDESIPALPIRTELKSDYSSNGRLPSRPISSPASHFSGSSASSNAGRVVEATHTGGNSQNFDGNNNYSSRFPEAANVGVSSPNLGGSSGRAAPGVYPNAWAIRKETVSTIEPLPATWSSPNAAAKLAHASALDKVSSGRWQSKQTIHHPADVEVIRHTVTEIEFNTKSDGRVEYHDEMLVRHAERTLTADERIQGGVRELPNFEQSRFPIRESIKSNPPSYVGARSDFGESELQFPLPLEQSERPKLKLLPRSKPLEGEQHQANTFSEGEPPVDYKQVHKANMLSEGEQHVDGKKGHRLPRSSDHVEDFSESYANINPIKSGLAGSDIGNLAVERPKLNLKPRSQGPEQLEGNIISGRKTVFGGARPRELVLKERGIDDVAVNNDVVQSPNRVKQDVPRTETLPAKVTHARYNEKAESFPLDNRVRKNNDTRDDRLGVELTDMQRRDNRVDVERTDMQRRDSRVDVERIDIQRRDKRADVDRTDMQRRDKRADVDRSDMERKNWRSDNWRNNRETEKHHHQQQPQERPPSPETWRKPVEQPQPASPDTTGLRYGKAASAVDLAQAFSRSVSDPKAADRLPGQRGIPVRGQIPFSRLTDASSRPQINGY